MTAVVEQLHLRGQHDQQAHAGGGARRGGDRTGYPEVDAVIEDFLDEPLGDWTTSDTKIGDMEAADCAGACDSVAEQFTEYATERGLKVYTTRTSVDEMGYEITGDPAGQVMDADGNVVDGFYQEHTVNQVYVDGQGWPLTIDFTARQYGYDTPVKTDPAVREEDLAVEVFHLQGQHDQQRHAGGRGRDPLAPGTGVYQDDYGTLEIRSTGVDQIRQAVYDYLGGEDVFDIVVIENDDGTRSVDVENLYGSEGSVEGERALESYLNEGGIDDVSWDGERGTLHASHRGAINEDPVMKEFTSRVETTFSGAFETPDGEAFQIGETRFAFMEATGENAARAEINGTILDAGGEAVGTFSRAVYADGVVYNHSLNIYPEFQGQGIGTAFLDRTEPGLGKELRMSAVNVGKYAWAARGYRLDHRSNSTIVADTRDRWIFEARNALSDTPEWRAGDYTTIDRLAALEREWQNDITSIYPGDLIEIDPSLKSVLLNGPSWDAVRELDGGLTAAAGVEVFHLRGQHDQQTHAGDRASALGEDVTLDDLEWEPAEGVTADEIVSRFDLSDGGREYATTSGGRLYRAPDDRYVMLDPEGDDVYVTIVPDLYEAESNLDLDQIESDIEDSWREDVVRGPVYHGTRDDESLQSIMAGGLERRNETRGLNNRWVGSSVFTTVDPELASQYGSVVEVDLPQAITDGAISADSLSREPGYNRADAMQQIAYSFDDYNFEPYSQYVGSGEDPNTVIISSDIPARYIRPLDELSGAIMTFRAERRVADCYAVYRPVQLRFDPNQPRDETGKWTDSGSADSAYTGTAAAATERVANRARQGLDPSEFDGPLMSRGISITVDDDLKRRIDEQIGRGADPGYPEEFNQHLEIGPDIAEQLLDFKGHQDGAFENTAGFGQSWTTRESVAESVQPGPGQNLVVKVVARPRQSDILFQEVENDGRHSGWVDAEGNEIDRGGRGSDMIPGEMEVRVDGRSPVDIVDIQVRQGNRWESVWGDESGFGAGADELYRQFPHLLDDLAAGVEVFHLQGEHDQQSHAGGRGRAPEAGIVLDPDASHMSPMHERITIDGKTQSDVGREKWREMVKHQGAIDAAGALSTEEQEAIEAELESVSKNAIAARDPALLGFGEHLLMTAGRSPYAAIDAESTRRSNKVYELAAAIPVPLTLQLSHLKVADVAGLLGDRVYQDERFAKLSDALINSDASSESVSNLSAYVTERWGVTPASGVFHTFNDGWKESSRSARSLAVQREVAARYDIDTTGFDSFIDQASRGQDMTGDWLRQQMPKTVGGYVDGTYRRTQEFLAGTRAKEIPVYRGVKGDTFKPTSGEVVTGNPISSWTTSEPVAMQFSDAAFNRPGRVLVDYTDVADVFAISAVTGMGAIVEHEVILLGRPQIVDEVIENEVRA